ncbi:UbiA family prenyltransferase [Amycolatopsis lurida]
MIRRLEFYVVELTIFAMPVLAAMANGATPRWPVVAEGMVMYFVLYSLGDMVNCMADRDLDSVYKTRLSRAAYRVGARRIGWIVAVETVAGVALAVHLSVVTGRWAILALVLAGVFLGLEYSLGPVHFKRRGLGHLACLWLLLYFLPVVCAGLLVAPFSMANLVLAASYATAGMGIILVNTSEDLVEDRAAGVRTTTVALGLVTTVRLAAVMVAIGGTVLCAYWAVTSVQRHVPPLGFAGVAALAAVCGAVLVRLVLLARRVRQLGADETAAMGLVKAAGRLVPIAATAVGWAGVGCALITVTT